MTISPCCSLTLPGSCFFVLQLGSSVQASLVVAARFFYLSFSRCYSSGPLFELPLLLACCWCLPQLCWHVWWLVGSQTCPCLCSNWAVSWLAIVRIYLGSLLFLVLPWPLLFGLFSLVSGLGKELVYFLPFFSLSAQFCCLLPSWICSLVCCYSVTDASLATMVQLGSNFYWTWLLQMFLCGSAICNRVCCVMLYSSFVSDSFRLYTPFIK